MKKRIIIAILTSILVMGMVLTACGGKENIENSEVSVSQESEMEEGYANANKDELSTGSEQIQEEMDSETEEETVYIPEGVDINSTLSGEEWLASFDGVVEEPVVVVFNDTTGRKEVIQQNGLVYVNPYEEHIAMHYPEDYSVIKKNGIIADYVEQTLTYAIVHFDAELALEMGTQEAEVVIGNEITEWKMDFFLRPEVDPEKTYEEVILGEEWAKELKFYDIPKLIVWNDENGTKEIIDEEGTYQMQEGDVLAVYHGSDMFPIETDPVVFCEEFTTMQGGMTKLNYFVPEESQEMKVGIVMYTNDYETITYFFNIITP